MPETELSGSVMVGARERPRQPGSATFPSRSLMLLCEICFGLSFRIGSFLKLLVIPDRLPNKEALKSQKLFGVGWVY